MTFYDDQCRIKEQYRILFKYDRAGNLIEEYGYTAEGQPTRYQEYKYLKNSPLVKTSKISYMKGEVVVNIVNRFFKYYENGEIKDEKERSHWDGKSSVYKGRYKYKVKTDGQDRLIRKITYIDEGRGWQEFERITNQYDGAGRLILKDKDCKYYPYRNVEKYSADGRLAECVCYLAGSKRSRERYTYHYDTRGNQVKELLYIISAAPAGMVLNRYDKYGNLIETADYGVKKKNGRLIKKIHMGSTFKYKFY
jgi:hypothetical protein